MLVDEKVGGAEGKMKQFASWFTHGVPHGAQLRKQCMSRRTQPEILDAVDRFFQTLLSGRIDNASIAPETQEIRRKLFWPSRPVFIPANRYHYKPRPKPSNLV